MWLADPMTVESASDPEADVVLRDGSMVHVRPANPLDEPSIRSFLGDLRAESLHLRFGTAAPNLDVLARQFAQAPSRDHVALLGVTGADHAVVGEAGYERVSDDRAEVAIVVADRFHGRGLGTSLLGLLAKMADTDGIGVFEADVLPENGPMIEVFRESGLPIRIGSEPGVVRVEISTSMTPEARDRFEHREELAAAAAVRRLLSPRSIAVIGASRDRRTIGGGLFRNLLDGQFGGPVYPVNPAAHSVQGVRAYGSILEIPDPVDVALVVVPAAAVAAVARDCARHGVKGLVVISAGFSEVGPAGAERQAELLAICREAGMRLIGPNCMGVANTAADIQMNAQFAPIAPLPGNVGFLSQSGALGLALIDHANRLGLGLSTFVSVGNKADLSGNDFLCYWEGDEDTDVILLYLESLGNPRRFARIARRVARSKPIAVVKSGRSAAGARATSSHTGVLLGASDVTVDALFRQAGVIRTDTLAELFDVASLLANQPLPSGPRVAILTNGGGPGILAADACEAAGLVVPPLADAVRARLAEWLPSAAGLANPVDMIASATADDYGRAIEGMAADPGIDGLIVIFAPPLVTRADDVATAIRTAAARLPRPIPVMAVFMSAAGAPAQLSAADARIPSYTFPENAAHALARAVRYAEWRARPEGNVPALPGIREDEAVAAVAAMLAIGSARWLDPEEVRKLLECYGLPLVEQLSAASSEEAADIAGRLSGPVALKGIAPGVLHKTELQGVRLGLTGPTEVEVAADDITRAFAAAGHSVAGFLVQPMAPPGVEMLVGVVHDRLFGPVVACAAGGTEAELLKDVSVRITPLTDLDAHEMVRSLATFPLLDGYRGAVRSDVAALEDVLLRVSAMVEAHPDIAEMDLNPVIVGPDGALIVDARVRLEAG
jgi:acetyl coenzyme A synthetase (ADP forming)-like protein